jgi:hypothetical protein
MKPDFTIANDGVPRYRGRLCVPDNSDIKDIILKKALRSLYTIHLGSNKMYRDLRQHYWWSETKRDVANYVERCLNCQQIKMEHQRPAGTLQPLPIPVWTWDEIDMDFVSGFPRALEGYDSIWVVVDHL